jgi:hypothetical protein
MSDKFISLYLLAATHKFQGDYIVNSFKQIGFQGQISDKTLTFIGSFGALFNGTGKILLGASLDYFKFKPVYTWILVAIFTSLIMVHFSI